MSITELLEQERKERARVEAAFVNQKELEDARRAMMEGRGREAELKRQMGSALSGEGEAHRAHEGHGDPSHRSA